jgi:L-Ala-D/L-Glu epimerase
VRITAAMSQPIGGAVDGAVLHRGGLTRRDGYVVRLSCSDGAAGVGEACPLPGYSPDSSDEVAGALDRWCSRAAGRPLSAPADVAALLDGVAAPSLRFAIETAAWTVLARRVALPLHRLWSPGHTPESIPLRYLCAPSVEAVAALARRGVRHVKWKIGQDPRRELETLRALRGRLPAVAVQVDANGALSVADLEKWCDALADCGVELIEEPMAWDVLARTPPLRLPVALDESLQHADWAMRLAAVARTQTLAAVVLKPTTLGGIERCLTIARAARALGARPIVTHTFDGPLAMAAAAELALALPDAAPAGLAPHGALAAFSPGRSVALAERAVEPHHATAMGLEVPWC